MRSALEHRWGLILGLVVACGGPVAAQPRIEIDQPRWDFGTVVQGVALEHIFILRNAGDRPLVISLVRSSCAVCTGAMLSRKVIRPGGSGQMKATFYTKGLLGRQYKTLQIVSNDPEMPSAEVVLLATVVAHSEAPRLVVESGKVDLGVLAPGTTAVSTISIKNGGKYPLRIESVRTSASCQARIAGKREIGPMESSRIDLNFTAPNEPGVVDEYVIICSNDMAQPEKLVQITGYVSSMASREATLNAVYIVPLDSGVSVPGTGKRLVREFVVRNGLKESVCVRTRGSKDGQLMMEPSKMRVGPGAEARLQVRLGPKARLSDAMATVTIDVPLLIVTPKK